MAVVFTPPGAAEPPAGAPQVNVAALLPSPEQGLWDALIGRPTIGISVPTLVVSKNLWFRPALLDGWVLRETTGTASAVVEFIDGGDDNGPVVGEQTIVSPALQAGLATDVDVDNSATGAAAAIAATLPGAAGATTFITGFEITGAGATAASVISVTVTGVLGGTKTYVMTIPAGVTGEVDGLFVEYARPIPAAALNTAIAVNVPSFGAGNTNAAVTAHGFQRTSSAGAGAVQGTGAGPGGIGLQLLRNGLRMRVLAGSVTGVIWLKA